MFSNKVFENIFFISCLSPRFFSLPVPLHASRALPSPSLLLTHAFSAFFALFLLFLSLSARLFKVYENGFKVYENLCGHSGCEIFKYFHIPYKVYEKS